MKDYLVTVTISTSIRARNQEEAQERADRITEWLKVEAPKSARWFGDYDIEAQVEEEV